MTIRILLSKIVRKRKTKMKLLESIFNVENGKQKWDLEFLFPMAWVNEKRNCKFEFRFPTSYENGWQ